MIFERAPQPSAEQRVIFREMDPYFLWFYATSKTAAISNGMPMVFLYGDDPADIDHCVIVNVMPSGATGYSVHNDGNHAVQMEYVKSLLGPTYFAQVEPHITRGPEEVTADNIDEVLDRLKERLKAHLAGDCGCKDHPEQPGEQAELPLWVRNIMQEEKTDA
jgi:hypothetical protein